MLVVFRESIINKIYVPRLLPIFRNKIVNNDNCTESRQSEMDAEFLGVGALVGLKKMALYID